MLQREAGLAALGDCQRGMEMAKRLACVILALFLALLLMTFPALAWAEGTEAEGDPAQPGEASTALDREGAGRSNGNPGLTLEEDGFHDCRGRLVYLRGVNVAGNAKLPPFIPFEDQAWWDMLASWGFNMVRLTLIWEAIEPEPGVFDQAYLDKMEKLVDEASKRGIYVLLDMHQDLYSRWLGGDGAPYWAFPPQVDPYHNNGFGGRFWGLAYFFSSDVKACFAHFFQSQELREHCTKAWLEVAKRVKGNPYVLGYDIINELSSGDIPNGGGEFENGYLKPFYERVITAIRKIHPGAVGFVEPNLADMYTSKLTPFNIDGLVYAPHLYNPISNLLRVNLFPDILLFRFLIQPMMGKAEELGLPIFIGEFGAPWTMAPFYARNISVNNSYQVFEENFLSNAYWDYSVKDVDAWNEEDFSLIDEQGDPRGLEVNARPYVRRLNGKPLTQSFCRFSKVYRASFMGGAGGPPTVIYIPEAIQYAGGFQVEVSDGWTRYRRSTGELFYFPGGDGRHQITIRPG